MPPPSIKSQLDGVSAVSAGMNSGIAPRLLQPQQLAFAINLTNRGGLPRTRPVWEKVSLVYQDDTARDNAQQALFQCAHFYQSVNGGENCLVALIGGRLFRYLVANTNRVSDISIPGDLNDSQNPNAWMWQSEDFLIVQNGSANPLFFDGAKTVRSKGQGGNQLPAGCMGAYVQGRNWVVLPAAPGQSEPSQSFMAGDLVYSHGFQDDYSGRAAVLETQENEFFSGGGSFSVPITAGKINALSSVAIADTSLGQGPLQVLTQGSVFSVQVPLDRVQWAATEYPLMTIGLPNYGATGQNAVAVVNGDLWYRALDGIRSYQIARRDFNTWVNTPLSVEMELVLNQDTDRWLDKCSSIVFDNRLLVTCSPFQVRERGTAHRGLVALDFNNISNLTTRSSPAYDGLWTGLNILQLVKGTFNGVERCFAFCLDCEGRIVLYELLTDGAAYFDWNGDEWVGVESSFETRAMGWKDGGNVLKRLQCADLYLDRLAGPQPGTLDFEFKYRSDEDPVYRDWHSFSLCAPIADCAPILCPVFSPIVPQYRTYIRLPDPEEVCSQVTRRMTRTGYEFQVRMWWRGYAQLNRLHVWSEPMSDSVVQGCPTSENCTLSKGCDEPWFTYSVEGCSDQAMEGIVEEDTSIWITTEGNVVIREENQRQTGPLPPPVSPPPAIVGACYFGYVGGPCSLMTEADCTAAGGIYQGDYTTCPQQPPTPSVPNQPAWPPPAAWPDQAGGFGPITVTDLLGVSRFVGVNPGGANPADYTDGITPGATAAWVNELWRQFLATNTPYTEARIIWAFVNLTGSNFTGYSVFPNQDGNYQSASSLTYSPVVEWRYSP